MDRAGFFARFFALVLDGFAMCLVASAITLGYWISGFFLRLGYIWAAFDADGAAWHDKLFDTRVVRA